ncbi:MAG: diguanylate cyclase [Caldiserica bacterium]|nr:MAG: diguanylate cyclase [Caldisericota bacterium]
MVLIPVFIGITFLTFLIINLAPGGPEARVGFSSKISPEVKEKFKKYYGLDRPIVVRYFEWFKRFLKFNFGNSFQDGRPVMKKILERLPATVLLNALSMLLILVLGITLGVYSALNEGKFIDHFITVFVFVGFSIPVFWLGIILIKYLGVELNIFPVGGMKSFYWENLSFFGKIFDILWHLILPVLVLSFVGLAGITRYMRNQFLEVLDEDYIRTARAKGLPERIVIWRHAFRNASLPLITILGLSLPSIISGGVITEVIFSWPGMGRLMWQAVMARDYPLIMADAVIAIFLTLLGNLIADILYAYVDPRIRYG